MEAEKDEPGKLDQVESNEQEPKKLEAKEPESGEPDPKEQHSKVLESVEPEKPKMGYVDLSVTEGKAYETMTIEELQEAILSKMAKNGPITDQMLRSVRENVYPGSLLNWVRSFR